MDDFDDFDEYDSPKPLQIEYDTATSILISISSFPTPFYKVKVEDSPFHELASPNFIASGPYNSDGEEMNEEEFRGWEELASPSLFTTFCCSATYSDTEHKTRFALKGNLFLESNYSQQEIAQRVRREAIIYARHLQDLQGDVVPRHYGLWYAPQTKWGGDVLIAILDWAGLPWSVYQRHSLGTFGRRFRIMEALEKLHDRGICHEFLDYNAGDRHILFDEKTDAIRIIDFTYATKGYECKRLLPVRVFKWLLSPSEFGCSECYTLRRYLRLFESRFIDKSIPDIEVTIVMETVQMRMQEGLSRPEALRVVGKTLDRLREEFKERRIMFEERVRQALANKSSQSHAVRT